MIRTWRRWFWCRFPAWRVWWCCHLYRWCDRWDCCAPGSSATPHWTKQKQNWINPVPSRGGRISKSSLNQPQPRQMDSFVWWFVQWQFQSVQSSNQPIEARERHKKKWADRLDSENQCGIAFSNGWIGRLVDWTNQLSVVNWINLKVNWMV